MFEEAVNISIKSILTFVRVLFLAEEYPYL